MMSSRMRLTYPDRIDISERTTSYVLRLKSYARRQNAQLRSLLEEDSASHPSNKKAKAAEAALTIVRNELMESRDTHAITKRELERALDINDKSVVEYMAQVRAITDWKNTCASLKKQLTDKTQEFTALATDCAKKDRELETLREGRG